VHQLWQRRGSEGRQSETPSEFVQLYRNASESLTNWLDVVEHSAWKNPAELRRTFASADFVGEFTILNIGGNNFRLIAQRSLPAADCFHQAYLHARSIR
jgi:mRNA-degrading endonuclease HigB of HigAB toxin-antitoxin module